MSEANGRVPQALAQPPALSQPPVRRGWQAWRQGLLALAALYLFIVAINLMSHGLKTIADVPDSKAYLQQKVFSKAAHPVAGLCIGILVTSVVQSSSFTTSFTVGLVVAGELSMMAAIPIIMGANVGTSVTNILVSLAHLRRRREFRRSLGGAIVHDFFNVLTVLTLLPLELAFGVISRPAGAFARWLEAANFFTANPGKFNILKIAVEPPAKAADWLLLDLLGLSKTVGGAIEAGLAVVLLFVALIYMVRMLQGLLKERLAGLFSRTLFRNHWISFMVGLIATASIQSSSVTTSLVVPLVGAGILTLRQIFPYTLGANIGTTVTAILAGLALAAIACGQGPAAVSAAAAGLAVAFAHLLFNVYGTCIFWPLQWIPISLAKGFAKVASKRRVLAGIYILVVFFLVPIVLIILVNR